MSESAPQEHPDSETSASDLGGAAEATGTTQQLPRAGTGPISAFRRIPAPARSLSVVVVAALAVAGVTYFAFPKSPGNTNAATASESTAIPGPMPGAPKTPTVRVSGPAPAGSAAVVPQAKVPTALRPSNPSMVKAWNAGPGGKALVQVTTQSGNALMANAGQEYAQMLLSCKALNSAVGTARQAAPIQDASMQKEYAAALSSLKLGAENCISGIKQVPDGVEDTVINVDHTTLNTAVSELSTGVSALYAATEVLR